MTNHLYYGDNLHALRELPEPALTLPAVDQGDLVEFYEQGLKRTEAEREVFLNELLNYAPDLERSAEFDQFVMRASEWFAGARKILENMEYMEDMTNRMLSGAALAHLYALDQPMADYLRASTGYLGKDLTLDQHIGLLADLMDGITARDSTPLESASPLKAKWSELDETDAWRAVRAAKRPDESLESAGVEGVEPVREVRHLLFEGQYLTELLGKEVMVAVESAKGAPPSKLIELSRKAQEAAATRPELEQRLLDLRDRAAASPEQRQEESLGATEAWFGQEGQLTRLGELMAAFIAGKSEGKVPENSNVGRLLLAMKKHRALHGTELSAYPYGELRVVYDARDNHFRVVEVYETANPGYADVFHNWRTGGLMTVQEQIDKFLAERIGRWDERNKNQQFWKDNSPAVELVRAVVERLGLKDLNIRVHSTAHLDAVLAKLLDRNPLLEAELGLRYERNPPRASVTFTNGEIIILYDENLEGHALVEALGHELGHVVLRSLLDGERAKGSPLWQRVFDDYVRSKDPQHFMEWFSDEMAQWVRGEGRIESGKDSLINRIVKALKSMLESLGLAGRRGAVAAYLDGLALRESGMAQQALLAELSGRKGYDLLTFQMALHSRVTPLLRQPVPGTDYLTLDGVRQSTGAMATRAANALPVPKILRTRRQEPVPTGGRYVLDHRRGPCSPPLA